MSVSTPSYSVRQRALGRHLPRALVLTLGLSSLLAAPGPARADAFTDAARTGYVVTLRATADASQTAAKAAAVPTREYTRALHGFAAQLTDAQVARLYVDPQVLSVERDTQVRAADTQVLDPASGLYGLDRSDQARLPLTGRYSTTVTGAGVTAYVIDSGVDDTHPGFGGRAVNTFDALGGTGQDCNGHGTRVAGIVAGAQTGVAKAAQVRGVRVLDCSGTGTLSGLLAGLDWVKANASRPAVATLSLSGDYSTAINTATTDLAAAGIFVAAAAGNDNRPACEVSPASASAALVVAATDRSDTRAAFSNYGSCVDLYAPGVGISSTSLFGSTATDSGTSMSAPFAAGVAALYKSRYGDAPSSTVGTWLVRKATPKLVRSNPVSTPNLLLTTGGL